jgi:hypothetical protein
MLSTISSPSTLENAVFRSSSDFCAASLPLKLVLRSGESRDLGVEGGLQVVGLLGPLLERARPLLGLVLLRLRSLE